MNSESQRQFVSCSYTPHPPSPAPCQVRPVLTNVVNELLSELITVGLIVEDPSFVEQSKSLVILHKKNFAVKNAHWAH